MRPMMKAFIRDRDLLAGLSADLALHHDKAACLVVLRFQMGVFFPSRVQVGLNPSGCRWSAGVIPCVDLDDKDGGLPVDGHGIVLEPAETDEHIAGLGPGRFEIPVALVKGFDSGLPTSLTWISPLQKYEMREPARGAAPAARQTRGMTIEPRPSENAHHGGCPSGLL